MAESSLEMEHPCVSDPGLSKEASSPFCCSYCDTELVHKLAQLLLPGLAAACVDSTRGDLFRSPSSVAVYLRKEMAEYLNQRSELFITESVVGGENNPDPDKEVSDDPCDIISDFMEDFSALKRNFFSRVSGWLMSESREDRIDDFVQEMEMSSFWSLERREAAAEVVLRNIDIKCLCHCPDKFDTEEMLAEHRSHCNFRPVSCTNEGCTIKASAVHIEEHDSVCAYKILPCEQKCSESLTRHEMDRHCVTVCPMKLINCPFYQVGCESAFPKSTLGSHCSEFLHSHMLYVLRVIHKDAPEEELKHRLHLLEKSDSDDELSGYLDVRSLTSAVKRHEAHMNNLDMLTPIQEDR